jgi:hypothetical protein
MSVVNLRLLDGPEDPLIIRIYERFLHTFDEMYKARIFMHMWVEAGRSTPNFSIQKNRCEHAILRCKWDIENIHTFMDHAMAEQIQRRKTAISTTPDDEAIWSVQYHVASKMDLRTGERTLKRYKQIDYQPKEQREA